MEKLRTIFAQLQAPDGLYDAIVGRITQLERRSARIHAGFFAALSLLSFILLIPALQYAMQQFHASGFYEYAALLFSDSSLVATYWREFGLSLLESLPSLAILILVPIAVTLLWSLKRTAQTARIAFA